MPKTPGKTRKKKTRKADATQNGVVGLMKELWEAAVELRGSIEPADYKRYVLPLIFLRFLSLRYEKRREEIDALIADPKSDYYTTDEEEKLAIREDADEYRRAGAFVVPEKARWDYLLKHAQDDDIKVKLDDALQLLEETYAEKLRGLLPRIYAGSNMSRENVSGLINLFSRDIFKADHGGEDVVGRVYEYFIGEFASSEGKRGGEYFTPFSIVRTLVAMLEPTEGVVFDPCCGSGGMFVQSDLFTDHSRRLSFVGQESKDFTYRLCRMNLFIHGIDGNIQLGNSYVDDKHADLRADYILANPPFNDGIRSKNGWGTEAIDLKDARLKFADEHMTLSPRNANTMWIMHFLYHLKEGGTAGFVMATGELSSQETARRQVRQALVDLDFVDCIVALSGQLFAQTQIPCSLWLLSKNRKGGRGFCKRTGQVLFIDGRSKGSLIPGSRKQKELAVEEIAEIAAVYQQFRDKGDVLDVPGFCRVASVEEIREQEYMLVPGLYVDAAEAEEDDEPFEDKMPRLVEQVGRLFKESGRLEANIVANLRELGFEI